MVVSTRRNPGRGSPRADSWLDPQSIKLQSQKISPSVITPLTSTQKEGTNPTQPSTSTTNPQPTSVPNEPWEEHDVADMDMTSTTADAPSEPSAHSTSNVSKDNKKRPIVEITTDILHDSRITQHPTDVMYDRGEHMTEAITDKTTPVRIEFNLKSTVTKFSLYDELIQLYTKLRITDKNLTLTPPSSPTHWTDEDDIHQDHH